MISVIPERILQSTIIEGLRRFRRSPKLLATLFQNLTDKEFQQVVKFITEAKISIAVNYPRAEITPPMIVILLKSENEAETFLGDHMGSTAGGMTIPEHTYDTEEGHAASTGAIAGLPQKLLGPLHVATATTSSVTVIDDELEEYLDFIAGNINLDYLYLAVVAGTGKGNVYPVRSLHPSSIDIEGIFTVGLDSTSVVDLRESNTALPIVGEPARVFPSTSHLTRRGANFSVNYQVDVLSGSQEEVIYLYFVLKAVFFLQRSKLEEQGIQAMSITGSDFAPRSEFLPDELYHRVMNLSFHYPFSVVEEEENLINQIEFALEPDSYVSGDATEPLTSVITLT